LRRLGAVPVSQKDNLKSRRHNEKYDRPDKLSRNELNRARRRPKNSHLREGQISAAMSLCDWRS
jgi:hypothetical protein